VPEPPSEEVLQQYQEYQEGDRHREVSTPEEDYFPEDHPTEYDQQPPKEDHHPEDHFPEEHLQVEHLLQEDH
jgi:hypothetical protein